MIHGISTTSAYTDYFNDFRRIGREIELYYIFHNNLIFWHIITLLLHIVVREDFVGDFAESLFESLSERPLGAFFLFLLLFFLFALLSLASLLAFFLLFSRCALAARAAASCSFSASSSTNMSIGFGGMLAAGCCCTGFTSCRQQFSLPAASNPSRVLCMPSFLGSSLCVWTVACTNLAVFTFQSCSLYGKLSQDFFRLAPPPVNTTPEKSLSS